MKTIITSCLFILLASIHTANSLTCYKCDSTISYADCESKQEQVACGAGEDTCIKGDLKYTLHSQDHKFFRKYCAASSQCDKSANLLCKTAGIGEKKECNIHCCSLNICNAGSSVVISSFTMIMSIMIGILVFH